MDTRVGFSGGVTVGGAGFAFVFIIEILTWCCSDIISGCFFVFNCVIT